MSATTPFSLSSVDAHIALLSQKRMEIIFQLSAYGSYWKANGQLYIYSEARREQYRTRGLGWPVTTNTAQNTELLIREDEFQNIINGIIWSGKDTRRKVAPQVFYKPKKKLISTRKMFWIWDFWMQMSTLWKMNEKNQKRWYKTECCVRIVMFYHYQK